MSSGYIGSPVGNSILPVVNLCKQTKWIPLVLTTDITCPQTGFAVTKCLAQFTMDSAGQWYARINGYFSWDSATVTSVVITFPNLAFYGLLPSALAGGWAGAALAVKAVADTNSSTISCASASTASTTGLILGGQIALKQQPTAYTIAANMENSQQIAAYIPSAGAATAGLVDTGAQTFAGEKTFSSAPSIPTATPATSGAAGITGQIAWDASYIYVCVATNSWKRVGIAAGW